MACLDAISPDNYVHANITLAKLFGLQTAVYWAELSRVLPKVKKKVKFDEHGFFKLDRKYIEDRTTLSVKEQNKCDKILATAGILAVDPANPDRVSIDVKLVLSLIIDGDVDEVAKKVKALTKKATPKEKREAKIAGMKATMLSYITETDNLVYEAYKSWIDVVVGERKVNRVTVETFQNEINKFTSDRDTKIKLIEWSASHTYIEARWAIENLGTSPTTLKPQKVGTSVKDGVEF